ncbi:MAG: PH domain-containing protein [Clostridia bacterium]|nr:PH domain-containing protein [Clostridia bacterium]
MTISGQITPDTTLTERRQLFCGLPLTRTQYVLTEDTLKQLTGILSPVVRSVNVSQIRSMAVQRSFLQKRLGLTTIRIATNDPLISELVIRNIRNGALFEERLRRHLEQNQAQQPHTF